MSKNCRFRRPCEKQHGKRSETLLKSARQHRYYNWWLLWKKLRWKRFLLVISKFLGLPVNTLSTDYKYSCLNRDDLMQSIQMELSQKKKVLIFFSVLKMKILNILKKRWPLLFMSFRKYRLQTKSLDKYLKSLTSEDPATSNMVNKRKHCWNLHDSSFMVVNNYFEQNWVGKSLS